MKPTKSKKSKSATDNSQINKSIVDYKLYLLKANVKSVRSIANIVSALKSADLWTNKTFNINLEAASAEQIEQFLLTKEDINKPDSKAAYNAFVTIKAYFAYLEKFSKNKQFVSVIKHVKCVTGNKNKINDEDSNNSKVLVKSVQPELTDVKHIRFLKEHESYLLVDKHLEKLSVKQYLYFIKDFLLFLEKNENRFDQIKSNAVIEWLSWLRNSTECSDSYASIAITALKGFYKQLILDRHIESNPTEHLKSSAGGRNLPDILSLEDINQMLSVIDAGTFEGLRDKTIIELMYATGCRVSEICGLAPNQINLDSKHITVIGKRRKQRVVLFGNSALNLIEQYLKKRAEMVPMDIPDSDDRNKYLFFGTTKHRKLTGKQINLKLKHYALKANLTKNVHNHLFRHSCATHLLENDVSIRHVQALLGHSSIDTTQIYTHISKKRLKETYEQFHPRAFNSSENDSSDVKSIRKIKAGF